MTYDAHLKSAAITWQRRARVASFWARHELRNGQIHHALILQEEARVYAKRARQYLFELIERKG